MKTMKTKNVSRRKFIKTSTMAATMLATPLSFGGMSRRGQIAGDKMKIALVGTGSRGNSMWGRDIARSYADRVEFVGLCDHNPGRLAFARQYIGVDCPTFSNFEEMIDKTGPDTVVVTTIDSTHDQFTIKSMEMGCDVISEKPLTTDETKCQAILDTQEKTGRNIIVTFNARYSPHREKIKTLLQEEHIGRVTSVDFHWYLNIYHGADYFRRWHGKERFSGTLYVHKACHHFDLLNWWLNSEPAEVFGYGNLEYYGKNNDFRHTMCRGCPHKDRCRHFWDIKTNQHYMDLYVANEQYDGYHRDGCVWSEEIDIYDKMAAQIMYANDVHVSYSCTTYSPYEGYRIAFNGTKGRLEAWIQQQQPWQREDYDEIRITDNFGDTQVLRIPRITGGHEGGDRRLKNRIFREPDAPDPTHLAADSRDGAMAILLGIAARNSVKSGQPVQISSLTSLKPRAERH